MNSVMVLDPNGNPVWCHNPEMTVKFLEYRLNSDPDSLANHSVRFGYPQQIVTIETYLDGRKTTNGNA
jgi:hypothetical protein